MKFFSRPMKSYPAALRWGLIALAAAALLRMLAKPLLGIPIEIGGTLTSLTWVMALSVIGYSAWFGWMGGRFGDVIVTAVLFTLTFYLLLVVFLPLSSALALDNYFLDPSHIRGPVPRHLGAHASAIPFQIIAGTILGGLAFGVAWAVRKVSRSQAAA